MSHQEINGARTRMRTAPTQKRKFTTRSVVHKPVRQTILEITTPFQFGRMGTLQQPALITDEPEQTSTYNPLPEIPKQPDDFTRGVDRFCGNGLGHRPGALPSPAHVTRQRQAQHGNRDGAFLCTSGTFCNRRNSFQIPNAGEISSH